MLAFPSCFDCKSLPPVKTNFRSEQILASQAVDIQPKVVPGHFVILSFFAFCQMSFDLSRKLHETSCLSVGTRTVI